MCALAHVFEDAGIATVVLASVWGQVERSRPPRALYCEFPLGRPLGRPNDAGLHHRVLGAALALLERPEGPVLERWDEIVIDDDADSPAACVLPPRLDTSVHPAVDEVRALADAHARAVAANQGRTALQYVEPDQIAEIVTAMVAVVDDDTPWKEAGLPAHPHDAMIDLRAWYEEAAMALADTALGSRSAESWFYERTEAGALTVAFKQALKEQGASFGTWFYTTPFTR